MTTQNTPLLLGAIALALSSAGCNQGRRHRPPPAYTYTPDGAQVVVGGLHVARTDHSMTLVDLANDQLLVAGGVTSSGPTDTAELIDGDSGQSRVVAAPMTTPRRGHVAAADGQKRVVLFGGADDRDAVLSSIEVFDVVDEDFRDSGETLFEPRVNAAAAVDGDRLVIAGGGAGGADSLEVWSLSRLERTGLLTGLAGSPREDVQIVQVDADLFFLYGGLRGQPNLWIDLALGQVTPAMNGVPQGGTVFTAPFVPGAALVVGGFDATTKFQRGVWVVRPGQGVTATPEVLTLRLFQDRVRPIALGTSDGIYFLAGHVGAPVSLVERVSPQDAELYPDLFGAPSRMQAAYLGTDHIVTSGGVGPDGEPLALINILLPTAPTSDGAFDASAARRARNQQLDADRAIAYQQLTIVHGDLGRANAALAAARADLQAELARGKVLRGAIAQAKQRIADLDSQIADLQMQVPALQGRVVRLQGQAQASATQRRQAEQDLTSLGTQLTAAQRQLNATRSRVTTLSGQLTAVNATTSSLRSQVSSLAAGNAPTGSAAAGRGAPTATGRTGTAPPSPATTHGPVASLYRPSGAFYGPGSAPNVPYTMAYARDAHGRTWVAIVTHQGKTLVYSRDATLADGVPSHMTDNVTIKPR